MVTLGQVVRDDTPEHADSSLAIAPSLNRELERQQDVSKLGSSRSLSDPRPDLLAEFRDLPRIVRNSGQTRLSMRGPVEQPDASSRTSAKLEREMPNS